MVYQGIRQENRHREILERLNKLEGKEICANRFIDAVPILAVLGCYVKGATVIEGAHTARLKECDRIKMIGKYYS